MPECHKCKWNNAGPSPEKETACLSCHSPVGLNNHGATHVSLDAGSRQTYAEAEASMRRFSPPNGEDNREIDEYSYNAGSLDGALRLMQFIMDLDPSELSMLVMVAKSSIAEFGRNAGISRQGAWLRWTKLVSKYPYLKDVVRK